MRKLKIFGISVLLFFAILYILFLISPAIITPILNNKTPQINEIIEQNTGFKAELNGISFVTSWNFSAGVKIKELKLVLPNEKKAFFYSENIGIKLSLLPVLRKKIELDSLFADSVYADIALKEDGGLLLLDFLPKNDNPKPESFEIPFGLRLSNNLPSIFVKSYRLAMIDNKTQKSYFLEGEDFKVTNFVLDKRVKVSTKGKVVFDDTLISQYDIKIYNKIMPNLQLQDLLFPPEADLEVTNNDNNKSFNIIDIFNKIVKNKFRVDLTADIKTSGTFKEPHQSGYFKLQNISVAINNQSLPKSSLEMTFKGNKTDINSVFYTANDKTEKTVIRGSVKAGKNKAIDLNFNSNAKFPNIIAIVNSVAESFNINDFKTLSATGGIDANFKVNSDFKKVLSNGYIKVLPSTLSYGLYNVKINDISADVSFENNNINILKAGFAILGQPLTLSGFIKSDTTTDLKLIADKLTIKGLLTALGQFRLIKDNDINGGVVSINAIIKGKLKEIKPKLEARISNINIYNKSLKAKVTLLNAIAKFIYDGKNASGNFDIDSFGINITGAKITIPKASVNIDPSAINIINSYLMINNSRVDVKGAIKDYLSEKLSINLKANGNIQSSDIAAFLPADFRSLISYKGKMPLNVEISGNTKVQNIKADLEANSSNYISLIDINSLRGQRTKIHSNIEIIGDSLTFSNTGISNNSTTIANLGGEISKLYSSPKLNLNISVPTLVSFPIWGVKNSNISANGNIGIIGDISNPNIRGSVNITDISIKDIDFAITDMIADLTGAILNGSATVKQFRVGDIIANDLSGNFSLKDYSKLYLSNVSGKAFDGNVKGKLSYDINGAKTAINFIGEGLNSTKAVEGAAGIKNALTGVLGFSANLAMHGLTDKELINSMKGNISFNIEEGRFVSIGKLENLVAAQNINSNSILKSAISALSTLSTIQNADRFKAVNGNMTFDSGNAHLTNISVSGPLMSYFVKGTYYILPNSANLTILGRLDSTVVSVLGPLGQLSAEKLLSYIPKFGPATANILNQLTQDPANENTSLIPALSSGSKQYKDFKVIFNGPVGSASSVKNFKWLSKCDTTEMNLKLDIKNAQDAVKQNITTRVEETRTKIENIQKNVTNIVETRKQEIEQTKSDIQKIKENSGQSADNLKNLFQNALKNSQQKMPKQN